MYAGCTQKLTLLLLLLAWLCAGEAALCPATGAGLTAAAPREAHLCVQQPPLEPAATCGAGIAGTLLLQTGSQRVTESYKGQVGTDSTASRIEERPHGEEVPARSPAAALASRPLPPPTLLASLREALLQLRGTRLPPDISDHLLGVCLVFVLGGIVFYCIVGRQRRERYIHYTDGSYDVQYDTFDGNEAQYPPGSLLPPASLSRNPGFGRQANVCNVCG